MRNVAKAIVATAGMAVAMPAFGQFGGFGEILSRSTGYSEDVHGLTGGDITGDGIRDIVFLGRSGVVAYYRGFDDGVFDDGAIQIVTGDGNGRAVVLFDYDNDGDMDLMRVSDINAGDFRVYANDGAGEFTFEFAITGIGSISSTRSAAMADFDGDGDQDAVIMTDTGLTVIRNTGGDFSRTPIYVELANFTGQSLAVADIDGDGREDVVANSSSNNAVYLVRSTGSTFEEYGRLSPGSGLVDVKLMDMDADGDQDLIVAYNGGSPDRVVIYRNNGSGSFEFVYGMAITTPSEVEVVDIDADGDVDVLVEARAFSTDRERVSIFLNDGEGHFDLQDTTWSFASSDSEHFELIDMDPATGPDLVSMNGGTTFQGITIRLNQTPFFAPTEPTLLTPADGATNLALPGQVSAWGGQTRPMVSWERAEGFGVSYTVVVSESPTLSSPVFDVSGLTSRSADLSGADLRPGTTYYWTVLADNPRGSAAAASGPFSFTTADSGVACPADFDGDGELTIFDFLAFSTAFDAGCP